MNQTEPAQLIGGPLCGTPVTIPVGKSEIVCGARVEGDAWTPGPHDHRHYRRTTVRTTHGATLFAAAGYQFPQSPAAA